MQCFACENEATKRCPRCGNLYCDEHGANLCANCLDPMRAAPSRSLFRFALFGLFGGAVLALWLLIRPPSVPGEESTAVINPTTTPALTPGGGTGTPGPTEGGESPTPSAAPTPTPAITFTPAPTPTPGPVQYTVQDGDTWFGIADQFGVNGFTLAQYNSRSLEDVLHAGETLLIPPP